MCLTNEWLINLHLIMKGVDFMKCKDLILWQKSMDLVEEVYLLIKKLPQEEIYALSSQMRRAVVSIPSNVAEGSGRKSPKDYIRFLYIARGSQYELETQVHICIRLNYLTEEETIKVFSLLSEVGKLLNSFINKIESKLDTNPTST